MKDTIIIISILHLVLTDCKDWYSNGSTTSGLYNINPDGGTPFEVS